MEYALPKGNKIVCQLCRHACHIAEGKVGFCGANKNEGGHLLTLVYGHPAALNVDPVEKKPLFHFLPGTTTLSFGTVGCNFHCPFCQNWQISQEHHIRTDITVTPEEMVAMALREGCASISYTYNEPTIFYPYARDIALLARNAGLKNIFVTNGFESAAMVADMEGIIDAANVDLKSFNPAYYAKTLIGGLDGVKETMKLMKRHGIWVEVTTLVIEGINDSDEELAAMAAFIANDLGTQTPWHLSAFHPDYKMTDTPPTHHATLERAEKIGRQAGLSFVYLGNVGDTVTTVCPVCTEPLISRYRFALLANHLVDGACPVCKTPLPGIWR